MQSRETGRGLVYGLAAGATFGIAAPLAKRLVADVPPLPLAALLYVGGALGLGLVSIGREGTREARVRRADAVVLSAMILVGGLVGPVLLLTGLRHASGVAGALLLNLEAPFTMLLAVALFGEHLGGRAAVGAALVVFGATLLSLGPGAMRADAAGGAAIAAACLAWAIDNNLSTRMALRDPVAVARWKTGGAGALGVALAALGGYGAPPPAAVVAALGVGCVGYGISIVLAVRAMRLLGAARQAACFAIAPFVGALAAIPLLGETVGPREGVVGALMVVGLLCLWREDHGHVHTHDALAHEHLHVHDEHHQHRHGGRVDEPHSHPHVHERLTHAHAHTSDAHHRHRH